MAYQTVWLALYDSKHFVFWPIKKVAKQFAVDTLSAILILMLGRLIHMREISYIAWFLLAVKIALSSIVIVLLINFLFYRNMIYRTMGKLRQYEIDNKL